MNNLRDKLIAEFKRIYWSTNRDIPMTHEMADAALAIFAKEKRK